MKRIGMVLIALALLLAPSVYAQGAEKEHPIEKWLGKCIQQDDSTAGTRDCIGKAYRMWDQELNKAYKILMNQLPPDAKKTLKASQLAWIKYRDAESKLGDEIAGIKGGTLYLLEGDNRMMSMVKERAMELQGYTTDLNE